MKLSDEIEWRSVRGKPVAIFDAHHYALLPWARWRRGRSQLRVLTVDYHCDTHQAFLRAAFDQVSGRLDKAARQSMIKAIDPADEASVERAVARLRHDEHIDAAIRGGIVDLVFIIAEQNQRAVKSREDEEYFRKADALEGVEKFLYFKQVPRPQPPMRYDMPEHRMVALDPPRYLREGVLTEPWPDRVLESDHLEDRLRSFDQICTDANVPRLVDAAYVLDLDLDAFNTRKAMDPDDSKTFRTLINGACGITIALEPDCFNSCWTDGPAISVDEALEKILAHIEKALSPT